MNNRLRLKNFVMPILLLLLWALILLFPLPSAAQAINSDVLDSASTKATTTIESPFSSELSTISDSLSILFIKYPYMNLRGFEQTALKAGDQFTLSLQNMILPTEAIADLRELGFALTTPMEKIMSGDYFSLAITLPASVSEGLKTIIVRTKDGLGNTSSLQKKVLIDTTAPTGTLTASFAKKNDLSGEWTAQVSGTFKGTGSEGRIINEFTYGVDKDGKRVDGGYTSAADSLLQVSSPFATQVPILPPDITWTQMGYGVTIADEAGNLTDVYSKAVPIPKADVPLIDHAINGSTVAPTMYKNIPPSIAIPYSLISALPKSDYYAVVFFDEINGCPNAYYQINTFLPEKSWGIGVRPDLYQHAYRSAGGGCMQEFNIDPNTPDGWFWGATANNASAAAIADDKGVPAFAICATAEVCDAVKPHPLVVTTPTLGISNVLFIPGIEGSNLYRHNDTCNDSSGTCDAPLWLPPNNSFVPELYLDSKGKSVHTDIYAKDGDILTQAFGKKFYASFVQKLDDIETSTKFGPSWKWKAIAYDWRLSLDDLVHNGVERNGRIYYEEPSSTPYIEQELRKLAATSKTGKVTIVAHSNGGLVAKALILKIGFEEADTLIDKVILVGTPQSGVPEAVGGLLYGAKQAIPGIKFVPDVLMSIAHARSLGLNSSMAYSLLPTDTYFNDVKDLLHPVVSFTATTLWSKERAAYGKAITNQDDLQSFALAREGGRTMPAPSNTSIPNILNSKLYQDSVLSHITLDGWIPPIHSKVYQIAGWGADTVSGIDLYERPKTKLGIPTGGLVTDYRPALVEDGDGTVPVPSALMMFSSGQVKQYWENLKEAKTSRHSYSHMDLFEIPQLQTFLQNLIAGSEDLVDTIHTSQPKTTDPAKKLVFILHSIEEFSVKDADNNYTGSHGGSVGEQIPDSTYGELGDTKYVVAPANASYELALIGTSSAPFTLDIEEMTGGVITASTTMSDIPATDLTHAMLTIKDDIAHASNLMVDTDGDGTTDYSVSPSTGQVITSSSTIEITKEETKTTQDSTSSETAPSHSVASVLTGSQSHSIASTSTAVLAPYSTSTILTMKIATTSEKNSHLLKTFLRSRVKFPSRPQASSTIPSSSHTSPIAMSSPTTVSAEENNQMAAVPESAFLRLLLSIAHLLSKTFSSIEKLVTKRI